MVIYARWTAAVDDGDDSGSGGDGTHVDKCMVIVCAFHCHVSAERSRGGEYSTSV